MNDKILDNEILVLKEKVATLETQQKLIFGLIKELGKQFEKVEHKLDSLNEWSKKQGNRNIKTIDGIEKLKQWKLRHLKGNHNAINKFMGCVIEDIHKLNQSNLSECVDNEIKELEQKLESYVKKVIMDYDLIKKLEQKLNFHDSRKVNFDLFMKEVKDTMEKFKKLEQKLDSYIEEHHGFAEATIERNENTDKKVDTTESTLQELISAYEMEHMIELGLTKQLSDNQEKTEIEPELMKRIMAHKLEPMKDTTPKKDLSIIELADSLKEKVSFKCPECNINLDYSTTGTTNDDPNETYYNCPNCLRRYSESLLKAIENSTKTEIFTNWEDLANHYLQESVKLEQELQKERKEIIEDLNFLEGNKNSDWNIKTKLKPKWQKRLRQ